MTYTPTTDEVRESYLRGNRTPPYADTDPLVRAEFDRWLAENNRQVAEKAWNEGYDAAIDEHGGSDYGIIPNPYRKES